MKRPALFLVTAALFGSLGRIGIAVSFSPPAPSETSHSSSFNAETTLALRDRISLSQAEISDLLLIPGVGDTLATNIIEKKGAIFGQALALPPKAQAEKALEVVHGIGPKTAQKLGHYLNVDRFR